MHQSRLKKIFDFRAIEGKVQGNSVVYDDKDVKVTITKQKFDKTKHKITKKKHKEYSEYIIDGKSAQGLDGDLFLPEDHYKSITVTINGKNVSIPKSAYDDLYQVAMYTDVVLWHGYCMDIFNFIYNYSISLWS